MEKDNSIESLDQLMLDLKKNGNKIDILNKINEMETRIKELEMKISLMETPTITYKTLGGSGTWTNPITYGTGTSTTFIGLSTTTDSNGI